MSFKETFGFEPASGGTLKAAQQLAVDAKLSNLARACSGGAATLDELRRALKKLESPDSASISAFAMIMAKVEEDAARAEADLDEAVRLAMAAGFVSLGRVESLEAKRIFQLSDVHQPLTAGELTRVSEVLRVLAARFHLARALEMKERQFGARDVQLYNSLFDAIIPAKQAFWEAHALASHLGGKVLKTYEEYLPPYCDLERYSPYDVIDRLKEPLREK